MTFFPLSEETVENATSPPIPVPEFLPFFNLTNLPSVKELSKDTIDSSSDPINIPDGLIFGDRVVTSAYVSKINVVHCMASICFYDTGE